MDTAGAWVSTLISVPACTLVAPVTVKLLPLRLRTIGLAGAPPLAPPPPLGAPAPGAPGAPAAPGAGAAPGPPRPWPAAPGPAAAAGAGGAPRPPAAPGPAGAPPRPPPAPGAFIVTRPKSPLHKAAPQVGSILQSLSSAAAAIPVSRTT